MRINCKNYIISQQQNQAASHQGFAVLVDEVLRRLGPFGQNDIIYPFLGDLQATQVKAWVTGRREDV